MLTRREWIRAASAAVAATAASRVSAGTRAAGRDAQASATTAPARPVFCFFSKPLPDLSWADLALAASDAGFEGIDLTVRPGGHVLPERAAADLPRAIEAIRGRGLSVPMITTGLTSADDPHARELLETAARHGVGYFKTGYWLHDSPDVRARVAQAGAALAGLASAAERAGIQLGFHNHAAYVGAALWDIAPAMDRLDPRWAGYYFDPRHAVAEGGAGAWKAATHLVLDRLKMIALKDCTWQKTPKGWRVENCPLGDGLVDWTWFGAEVKRAGFAGPISVHIEYEVGGSTPVERTTRTVAAARRDLEFARRHL